MGSFWNPHPLPTIFPTMRPFNMQLLKQAGLLWTGRLRVRGGLAREMRCLMKDTSPPTHTQDSSTHPHHRLFDAA